MQEARRASHEHIARLLASMFGSGKKSRFLAVLQRKKGDMYRGIASVAYGFKEEDIPDETRNQFKTMLFGLLYARWPEGPAD